MTMPTRSSDVGDAIIDPSVLNSPPSADSSPGTVNGTGSDGVIHHNEPTNSHTASIFVLCATTLGAGILALPYAFSLLGLVEGIILLLIVALIYSYAIFLLLDSAEVFRKRSYEDVAEAAIPGYGRLIAVVLLLVLIFGSLSAFLVIIGDIIKPAFQSIVGGDDWWSTREWLLTVVTIVVITPVSLLRTIHALEKAAKLAVCIIILFSILVIGLSISYIKTDDINWDSVDMFHMDTTFFSALPIISLALTCQTMVFPLWNTLERPTQPRMMRVVNHSLALCTSLYLAVGIFGYIAYDSNTESDVLKNLNDTTINQLIRLAFAVAIFIHYPVVNYAFRQALIKQFFPAHAPRPSTRLHVAVTLITIVLTLAVALGLPELSAVFSLTGAICAFPFCFILPAIFYLRTHTHAQWSQDFLLENGEFNDADQSVDGSQPKSNAKQVRRVLTVRQRAQAWTLLVVSIGVMGVSVYQTTSDAINDLS